MSKARGNLFGRIRRRIVAQAVMVERNRCAEIARKPSAQRRVPGNHDPFAWSSGYLQASDEIRARILADE